MECLDTFKVKKFLPFLACFSAGLFSFYNLFQISVFNVISADLLVVFHLTKVELGFFSSVYLLASTLWIIPGGLLLDRYSPRIIALIFCALDIIATFIIAISSILLLSVVMRFIQGLTSAMSLLICVRFASRWYPTKAAMVTGTIVAFALLGGISANSIFAKLVIYWHWRTAMLFNGCIGLVFFSFMLFFLYDRNISLPQRQSYGESVRGRNATIPSLKLKAWFFSDIAPIIKILIVHGVYIGLMNLPIFILGTLWGVLYLTQAYSFSAIQAPVICAMIYLGLIIWAPLIGYMSDKFKNRKKPLVWSAALTFLCMLPLLIGKNLNVISLGIIFFFLGFFSSTPIINYASLAEISQNKNTSTCSSIAFFITNLIGFFSQPLFGFLLNPSWHSIIYHDISRYKTDNYIRALMMLPISFIFCFLLSLIIIKETTSMPK